MRTIFLTLALTMSAWSQSTADSTILVLEDSTIQKSIFTPNFDIVKYFNSAKPVETKVMPDRDVLIRYQVKNSEVQVIKEELVTTLFSAKLVDRIGMLRDRFQIGVSKKNFQLALKQETVTTLGDKVIIQYKDQKKRVEFLFQNDKVVKVTFSTIL